MTDYDEGGEYDGTQDEPRYLLLAREAEMLMTGQFNLDKDPQRSGRSWPWTSLIGGLVYLTMFCTSSFPKGGTLYIQKMTDGSETSRGVLHFTG